MTRQAIDNGKWFNIESATKISEGTWWNGSNHISKATGSQWNHEALHYTKSGNWVLNEWSQWQGSGESWTQIEESEAVAWIIKNERFEAVEDLPENVRLAVEDGICREEA